MRRPLRSFLSTIQLIWMVGASLASFLIAPPAYADCDSINCDNVEAFGCSDNLEVAACCTDDCAVSCGHITPDNVNNSPSICPACAAVAIAAAASLNPFTKTDGSIAVAALTITCGETAMRAAQAATCAGGTTDPANKDCCVYVEREADKDGKGELKRSECGSISGGGTYYGDCYCRVGDTVVGPKTGQSFNSCTEYCKTEKGDVDTTQGIGLFKPKDGKSGGPNLSAQQAINALCFTAEECASPDYGGSVDAWVKDASCFGGKGKCRALEPVLTLSSVVAGTATVQGLRGYVTLMFRYMLSIVVLTAAVAFVWGGFKYIVGSSAGDISSAKNTMVNAVVGLLLCFGSVTILNTLNPATTRYDRLDVWLINKTEFARFQWCKDYKPAKKGGKAVEYADAGVPPGSASYDAATFDKTLDTTYCGKSYYPRGFGGTTCKGESCLPDKGKVCLPCSADIPDCLGQTGTSACIKAAIAGKIAFANGAAPRSVFLMGVCNSIQANPPWTRSKTVDAIPEEITMTLTQVTGDTGEATFFYPANPKDAQELIDSCEDQGGLRGVLFGVKYRDSATNIISGAIEGAKAGGSGTLTPEGVVIGGVVGGVAGAVTNDDSMVMGKDNCTKSVQHFDGYADGSTGPGTFGDMQTAAFCGYNVDPTTHKADASISIFQAGKPAFWTQAELEAAMTGDGAPITCDTFLNNANAPADPGTHLMGGCNSDSIYNP